MSSHPPQGRTLVIKGAFLVGYQAIERDVGIHFATIFTIVIAAVELEDLDND